MVGIIDLTLLWIYLLPLLGLLLGAMPAVLVWMYYQHGFANRLRALKEQLRPVLRCRPGSFGVR